MKNKQVTAILLSAVLALSSFMPMSSMSAFAAENPAAESTEAAAEAEFEAESPDETETVPENPAGQESGEQSEQSDMEASEEDPSEDPEEDLTEDPEEGSDEESDVTEAATDDEAASEDKTEEETEEVSETEDATDAITDDETASEAVVEETPEQAEKKEAALAEGVVASGVCGELATWTVTGTGSDLTLTISGSGDMTDYSAYGIPWRSSWDYSGNDITTVVVEDGVTSIGTYAFYEMNNLTSVSIGKDVSSIGEQAFYNCDSLKSITIPSKVNSIGTRAFGNCGGITNVVMLGGVESIGENAFSYCSSLQYITFPDSLRIIGKDAFFECSKLQRISLPDGVERIESFAFYDCSSLQNITIPDSVTSIERYAFYMCSSLQNIIIPDSVIYIEDGTFSCCTSLQNITIPDSVEIIGESAFGACTGLQNIEIPDSVTSIRRWAFGACKGLQSITIPYGVTSIEYGTFVNCEGLQNITIPDSVTSIGADAFNHCETLKDIYFDGTKAEWDAILGSSFYLDMENVVLHTTDGGSGAEKITLNKTSATLVKGASLQLKATVTPADATYGTVIWDSGNTNVATVNSSGIVTAVSAGTVTITASIEDGALKATCEIEVINPYTIKFNKNATKATLSTASKKVNPGSAVGTLPTPKYTGYYFLGWYTAKTGGTKVTAKTKPSKSVTLYAHWVKRVSINKAVVKVASCTYNGKAQSPAVTVTLGKTKLKKDTDYILTYSGSRTNANGKAYVTITGKNRYTGSVKKQFTVKPLPITSGAVNLKLKTTSFNYDGKAKKPGFTATSVLNSISRALSIGKDFKVTYSLNIKIGTAEVTFTGIGNYSGTKKLKFKIVAKKTATITFDAGSNGYFASGAPKKVKIVSNEVLGTVPKVIAKHGYKFLGWYDKKNGGLITKNTLFPYSEIVNRTAVAKYQKIVYTVTFKAREEDKERFPYQLPATIKYTVDKASSVVLPKLKAEGCTFHGWQNIVTTKDGKTTIKNVTSLAGVATNVVLYANYEPHMYTIEYQASEGGAVSNTSNTYCAIDKKIKLPKAVFTAPEGKTFDKWKCIETNTLYGDEEEIVRLTTNNGEAFHFVALWRDITWRERMEQFRNDSRWQNNASWNYYQSPLLSNNATSAIGCAAFVNDFVAYVYGRRDKKDDPVTRVDTTYDSGKETKDFSISNVRVGDVVAFGGTAENPVHYFAVLEINEESGLMYTMEGNYGDTNKKDGVIRSGYGYQIVNGELIQLNKNYAAHLSFTWTKHFDSYKDN